MDSNMFTVIEKRILRTVEALKKNNFDALYVKSREILIETLDKTIPDGASCSVGGSITLFETGVIDYIKSRKLNYLDRYAQGADVQKIFHDALSADFYITGSNAITESGELYNVDGRGNRVAAIAYGPKKVIVIAGANKIVRDLDSAARRNKEIAAPTNATRLKKDTPCAKAGFCADCKTPSRICCQELTSYYQCVKDRIAVFILPDSYGY